MNKTKDNNQYLLVDIENSILKVTDNFFKNNDIKEKTINDYFIGIRIDNNTNEINLCLIRRDINKELYKEHYLLPFKKEINVYPFKELEKENKPLILYKNEYYTNIVNPSHILNIIHSIILHLNIDKPYNYVKKGHVIDLEIKKLLFKIVPTENDGIFILKHNIYKAIRCLSNPNKNFSISKIENNKIFVNRYIFDRLIIKEINNYSSFYKLKHDFESLYKRKTNDIINRVFNKYNINMSYSYKNIKDAKYLDIVYDLVTDKIFVGDYNKYKKCVFEFYDDNLILNGENIDTVKIKNYQEISFSKLLSGNTTMSSSDIEKTLAKIEALSKVTDIEIVSGDDIVKYYDGENYLFSNQGDLGGSCMRYKESLKYIKFYAKNTATVSLAIQREKDKILSRALIWTDIDGNKIMDRIYSSYPNQVYVYHKYAEDNNIINIYKYRENSLTKPDLTKMGASNWGTKFTKYFKIPISYFPIEINNQASRVTLDYTSDPRNMPYMDNFKYFDAQEYYITNEPRIDKVLCIVNNEMINKDVAYLLHTGDYCHIGELISCNKQGIQSIGNFCEYSNYYKDFIDFEYSGMVFSKKFNSYLLEFDCNYIEEIDDFIPKEIYKKIMKELSDAKKKEEELDEITMDSNEEDEEEIELPF